MQPDITETNQPQENLLKCLLFKYIGYWPLFLMLLLICGTAAFLYLKYTAPVYGLNATLIIKDEQKGTDGAKMVESLDLFGSKKLVENEIEVIKSQTLAQNVVKNLGLYAPITQEEKFIKRSAYTSSPIQIIAKSPDSLTAVKKVYFNWLKNKEQVVFNNKAYPINQWINTSYGILKFKLNPNFKSSSNTGTLYFSLVPVTYVADDLTAELDVSSSDKLSTVVNISMKDEVPERGKAVLNELIAAYNRSAVEDKNTLAANTLSFVEDRLRYVVNELDSVESQLQHFKTQHNIVDIDEQGKMFLQNVGANDQKIGDLSMQQAILDQVESYVSGKGGNGGIVPSTLGVTDPVLSNLLDKLYDTELQYEKLRKIAPENNPSVVSLNDQINKLKPSILENIENQRKSLAAGKNDLAATNGKYSSVLNTMPAKERELLEISRQQAIKNNIYTFLLQKREEAAISYASAVANSRLVDSAQASRYPVSPDKLIILLIAIVAAFGLGIGVITVKEFFNNNIDSRTEVENYTQTPILCELVKNTSKDVIVVSDDNRSFIAEQFRQLRTMLGYLDINNKKKKILITSSISEEGKSFVAVNLAISLALANKKVVLVDLDLRRPALASILHVPETEGVTEYLDGKKEIESVIKRTDINENLFVIPSGLVPANPSELLLNGRLQLLFSYLDEVFDCIIIDSPPVGPVTDATIISPLCDATLYVIRQGVTPRMFVQKLDKHIDKGSLKNMAIVLNAVKGKGLGKYGHGYNYGYNYIEDRKSAEKKISKSF